MSTITKDLGVVTAYGYYKAGGGTMTESEFTQFMVDFGTASQTATEAAQAAAESAQASAAHSADAQDSAEEASQSASTASAKATEADTAAETAIDAKNDAITAKTAAETAQGKAEEAQAAAAQSASEAAESARTLTIDATLTQSGQAADAKETGDKISAVDVVVNGIVSKNYTEGKRLSVDSGVVSVINAPDFSVSDLIPITWEWSTSEYNRFYYSDSNSDPNATSYRIVFFDSEGEFLDWYGGLASSAYRAVKRLENAEYLRFSFKKDFAGKLTNGANPPTATYWIAAEQYENTGLVQHVGDLSDLDTTVKSSLVGAVNEIKGSIHDFPINPRDTTFFHISKNLIDPSACVAGQFVNQTNGTFVNNSNHIRTDFIEIEPETTYVVRRQGGAVDVNFRYAFYNSTKTYITGAAGSISDMLLTSPANAKYIVMSDTSMSNRMFALYENEDKSYEPYDNVYVLNGYIKQDMDDVLLTIPSKIYALVGYELNIYFENITEEWEKYKWDVTCSKGMQLERGYRITPVAGDVGTYTLTIRASLSDTISKEVTTTLVVTSASAGASTTKSVIVLGDSTTNNGIAITKLNENFSTDVMSISMLGTRGTAPNNHEGRSGWKLIDYFTVEYIDYTDGRGHVENPFYNPTTQTFDADYYFTNSEIAKPDWFIINMGINDVFSYETGAALDSAIETCIGYVDSMIASVRSASPSSKIGVCLTIPPNHSQDAFGKAYSNSQTRHRYKKNNTIWVNRLIAEYDNRESEGIYLIPIHTNLDTVYNMGMETLPVNARNTVVTYQSPISNGGVHPVESGYWQIADVYTAFLKGNA